MGSTRRTLALAGGLWGHLEPSRYRWGAWAVVAEACDGPARDWEWPLEQRDPLRMAGHDALWLAHSQERFCLLMRYRSGERYGEAPLPASRRSPSRRHTEDRSADTRRRWWAPRCTPTWCRASQADDRASKQICRVSR